MIYAFGFYAHAQIEVPPRTHAQAEEGLQEQGSMRDGRELEEIQKGLRTGLVG